MSLPTYSQYLDTFRNMKKNDLYLIKLLVIKILLIVQNPDFWWSLYYSRRRYSRRSVCNIPDNQRENRENQGLSLVCLVSTALNRRTT